MDFLPVAEAILAEVGLSFEDVFDMGRPWRFGPPGFVTIIGRPKYEGIFHGPSHDNPFTRQRAFIGISGPVDSEYMLNILAHECGHALGPGGSTPAYIQEYRAEIYAHEAIRRHLGRAPHPFIVANGKKYVRRHCWARYRALGASPIKGWWRTAVEWCGFNPGVELDFV